MTTSDEGRRPPNGEPAVSTGDDDVDVPEISPEAPLTGRDVLRADLLEPDDGRPVNEPPYEE